MDRKQWEKKAVEIVNEMTIEEAAAQLKYDAPPVKRLGIPGYNWWNEALHGVARAGTATVFPQAIGLAAMFDDIYLKKVADIIATEARAKYNAQSAKGDVDIYKGLTMWSPNINIFRDPRWGRGHETYGEDPYLTERMGVAFIQGLQGDGKYLKAAACAKHFAVHSGPEKLRHSFDAQASQKDMEETYLPAFEAAVKEAHVEAVMGAYNRTNGEPCCGSRTLLQKILREKWGFQGHVVSDCWAIADFHMYHRITETPAESAALAIKNGCDLNCGVTYLHLLKAYQEGMVTEDEIRQAAVRLLTTRAKLGMFDQDCEYDSVSYLENDTREHKEASLLAAEKSIVLLKNDGILPLCRERIRSIGVIGPNADSRAVLEGNYHGTASEYITNLEGIRREAGDHIRILYSQGSHLYEERISDLAWEGDRLSEAKIVAENSDVVILCVGLDTTLEGEQGDTGNSFASGDKMDLLLPQSQGKLIEAVFDTGKPVILVNNAGSAIDLSSVESGCRAVLQCWYSGSQGGKALANVLFGLANPAGRLPVTFYYNGGLPEFTDYSMKGRTYRYLDREPLYPFGYGLSYSSFDYSNPAAEEKIDGLLLSVQVTNSSKVAGDEVVELYLDKKPGEKKQNGRNAEVVQLLDEKNQPCYSLCGFQRIHLRAFETREVSFLLRRRAFETVLETGERAVLCGEYTAFLGGSQPDEKSIKLTGRKPVCINFQFQ